MPAGQGTGGKILVYWTGDLRSLDVIDPNPNLLLENGSIKTDTVALAGGMERREAAATDGVTRLVLRNAVPGPGTVVFSLDGAVAPEDGGLAELGSEGRADSVTATAVDTTNGFMAFAVYTVPDEFDPSGGTEGPPHREISLKASFTPQDGPSPTPLTVSLKLVRPPVLLIHGIWSDYSTWKDFDLLANPSFSVTAADYKSTNAAHFHENASVAPRYVTQALTARRMYGTAATQVDVVTHSMGGLLSRNHANLGTSGYKRKDNFMKGDFRKLVTLDTPHTGTVIANVALAMRADPIFGSHIERIGARFGTPITLGAVEDLATHSPAIYSIDQTPIPAHALVGIGGAFPEPCAKDAAAKLLDAIWFLDPDEDVFGAEQHDCVVSRPSQTGGLSSPAMDVFTGLDGTHTRNTSSQWYSARVAELLHTPASASEFDHFPAPRDLITLDAPTILKPARSSAPAVAALDSTPAIVSPTTGTVVIPGATTRVVVEAANATRVLIAGPRTAVVDDGAPFEFDLTIPAEAAGNFPITAFAAYASGSFAESNTVTLKAQTSATLQSVSIGSRELILLGPGSTRSLVVLGTYSDGVTRDITDPSTGTTYVASSGGIVTVSSAGVVTAGPPGTATVLARNGVHGATVSINVLP